MLNVPVNNFSVMSGKSHRFLGITSTFLGVNVSYSRTQHGVCVQTPNPCTPVTDRHEEIVKTQIRLLPEEVFSETAV